MDKKKYSVLFHLPNIKNIDALNFHKNEKVYCIKSEGIEDKIQFQLRLVLHSEKKIVFQFLPSLPVFMINSTLEVISLDKGYSRHKVMTKDYSRHIGDQWVDLTLVAKQYLHCLRSRADCKTVSYKLKFMVERGRTGNDMTQSRLSIDLNKLLLTNLYSDTTIISQDGGKLKVHKAMLASRSEVFQAMFGHDSLENQTNTLKTHLDSTVLREVLTYIYTDDCPSIDSMASELLAAADYYQISGLKILSQKALILKIDATNAMEMLEMSDKYSAEELKQYVLKYIIRNGQMKDILKSEQWKETKSLGLIKTMLEMYVQEYDISSKTNVITTQNETVIEL